MIGGDSLDEHHFSWWTQPNDCHKRERAFGYAREYVGWLNCLCLGHSSVRDSTIDWVESYLHIRMIDIGRSTTCDNFPISVARWKCGQYIPDWDVNGPGVHTYTIRVYWIMGEGWYLRAICWYSLLFQFLFGFHVDMLYVACKWIPINVWDSLGLPGWQCSQFEPNGKKAREGAKWANVASYDKNWFFATNSVWP